jgi:predicted TIM-barrel fold metal-dependent hydrolase
MTHSQESTVKRREFSATLGSSLGLALAAAAPLQLTQATEATAERTGWIDAHVHVWTPDVKTYPIDKDYKVADMQPPSFTAAELLQQCMPLGVDRIVLIQMSFYKYDHSYMFEAMRQHPGVFSAVAVIDHQSPEVVAKVKELVRQGAKGFRITSSGNQTKSWPASPTMQRLWQAAAENDFAICPLINPQDIQYVDALCQLYPKTKVVVDHFARVGMSGMIELDRLEELCKLARFPNVHLKTSAFYALGKKEAPYHDLKPMIRRVLDAFGPQRLMWATDCPYQVQGKHTYKASLDLILHGTEFLTLSDKQWILRDTAKQVFFS